MSYCSIHGFSRYKSSIQIAILLYNLTLSLKKKNYYTFYEFTLAALSVPRKLFFIKVQEKYFINITLL